jgi:hypothetical protein
MSAAVPSAGGAGRRGPPLLLCALLAFGTPALAGPPFITDDPEPVGLHHWEVNTAAAGSWRESAYSIGLPSIDINYGPTADLQLHALPLYSIGRGDGTTVRGVDDTEIGFKYRFFDHRMPDGSSLMLGIYPMYRLATGAHRLGSDRGTHGVLLPIWAEYEGSEWTTYGGAGCRINHAPGGKDSIFTGMTVLRKIHEGLQLGGEVFHETATAKDAGGSRGFNLGGIVALTRATNLLWSVGRTSGDGGSNLFYAGLQAHF